MNISSVRPETIPSYCYLLLYPWWVEGRCIWEPVPGRSIPSGFWPDLWRPTVPLHPQLQGPVVLLQVSQGQLLPAEVKQPYWLEVNPTDLKVLHDAQELILNTAVGCSTGTLIFAIPAILLMSQMLTRFSSPRKHLHTSKRDGKQDIRTSRRWTEWSLIQDQQIADQGAHLWRLVSQKVWGGGGCRIYSLLFVSNYLTFQVWEGYL